MSARCTGDDLARLFASGALALSRLRVNESLATFANPDFEQAAFSVLIIRLSPVNDVARSTPHLFLFGECRKAFPDAYIDFSFLPSVRDRATLDQNELPWFFGIASGKGANEFDIVLVSNSYSLELFNLPFVFSKCGMPIRSSARRAAGIDRPLVVLGGSNAGACGAIVNSDCDSLVDAIFFGEAEGYGDAADECAPVVPRILSALRPSANLDAVARLERARNIEGLFVAGYQNHVVVRRAGCDIAAPQAHPILNTEEASTARVQISFGCPSFCSFCFEGWDRKPYREVPAQSIVRRSLRQRIETGADSLEVYSFNFNTHSSIARLMTDLHRVFPRVDFLSQRADALADTPSFVDAEIAAGKTSFTVGVEGVSARMRRLFRKGLEDRQLDAALKALVTRRIREIKLFFILSGNEIESDAEDFARFVEKMRTKRDDTGSSVRIVFSFGRLVRMPGTPMAFSGFTLEESVWGALSHVYKTIVTHSGFEWRMTQPFNDFCADQCLVLGDGRLIAALEKTAERGMVYDGRLQAGAWETLRDIARTTNMFQPSFFAEKDSSYQFPLPFLKRTVGSEQSQRFYKEAQSGLNSATCLGAACIGCGACLDKEREALASHRISAPSRSDIGALADLVATKQRAVRITVCLDLPQSLYGSTPQFLSSWLLRRCFNAVRGSERFLLSARETLFSIDGFFEKPLPSFFGLTRFEIRCTNREATEKTLLSALSAFSPIVVSGDDLPDLGAFVVEVPHAEGFPDIGAGARAIRTTLDATHSSHIERVCESTGRTWTPTGSGRTKGWGVVSIRQNPDAISIEATCNRKANFHTLLDALGMTRRPMAGTIKITHLE